MGRSPQAAEKHDDYLAIVKLAAARIWMRFMSW